MGIFGRKKSPMRRPLSGAGTSTVGEGPAVTRVPVDAVPPTGVVTPGDPIDEIRGDPVLSRTVDPSWSEFKILGRAELYGPGETVRFFVQAISLPPLLPDGTFGPRKPIKGLPVIVKNKHQARQLGPRVMTDEQGIAIIAYTVQEIDQKGDPSTPDPDTGSYLCNAYIGGRLLNTVVPLWDEW